MAQISPWHSPTTRDARGCGWLQNVWLLHSCLSPPCVARNAHHRHCLLLLSARFPLGRSSCSACAGGFVVSESSTSLPVTLSLGLSSFWRRSERSCPPVSHLLTPPPPFIIMAAVSTRMHTGIARTLSWVTFFPNIQCVFASLWSQGTNKHCRLVGGSV